MNEITCCIDTIKDGDYVIFQKLHNKEFGKLIKIENNGHVVINKIKYSLKALLGNYFGSIFLMNNKSKSLDLIKNYEDIFNSFNLNSENDTPDNRSILNDNKSQKLSFEKIKDFKSGDFSTKEIVETFVENSSTFKSKTSYSQEKYVKKKQEKYSNYLRVYKPNAALLCEMYFSQGPHKTNYLRIDSFSQMLNYCNVRSGCKYMVIDTCNGLMTAAILERLLGEMPVLDSNFKLGKCVQIFTEPGPVSTWRQAVFALNYKEEHLKECLSSIQINKCIDIIKSENDSYEKFSDQCKKINSNIDLIIEELNPAKKIKLDDKIIRKKKRIEEEKISKQLLSMKDFDGLFVIDRHHNASEIVEYLLDFLRPSSSFVVFSNFIDPLTECYKNLKSKAINIKLCETWMRSYQILPFRTRPVMEMSGKSGYLLYGIKVHDAQR